MEGTVITMSGVEKAVEAARVATRDLVVRALRRDLARMDLRGANLSNLDLSGFDLRGANICGAALTDAVLRNADMRGAVGTPSQLAYAKWCGAIVDD